MFSPPALDLSLFTLLNQQWRSPLLDVLLPVFSLRAPLFAILAGLLVWRCLRRGKGQAVYFIMLVLVMGVSDFSTNQIKHVVGRLRPVQSLPGVYHQEHGPWQRLPDDYAPERPRGTSFPSAHAANSAALALMAALLWRGVRPYIWALPVVVGWSRLYVGKHFPLDVLAGWTLGLVVASLCWLGWKALARRYGLQLRPEK